MDFIENKNIYRSINEHRKCFNGSIGKIYNLRENRVFDIGCNRWDCPKCRPKKKNLLQTIGWPQLFPFSEAPENFRLMVGAMEKVVKKILKFCLDTILPL